MQTEEANQRWVRLIRYIREQFATPVESAAFATWLAVDKDERDDWFYYLLCERNYNEFRFRLLEYDWKFKRAFPYSRDLHPAPNAYGQYYQAPGRLCQLPRTTSKATLLAFEPLHKAFWDALSDCCRRLTECWRDGEIELAFDADPAVVDRPRQPIEQLDRYEHELSFAEVSPSGDPPHRVGWGFRPGSPHSIYPVVLGTELDGFRQVDLRRCDGSQLRAAVRLPYWITLRGTSLPAAARQPSSQRSKIAQGESVCSLLGLPETATAAEVARKAAEVWLAWQADWLLKTNVPHVNWPVAAEWFAEFSKVDVKWHGALSSEPFSTVRITLARRLARDEAVLILAKQPVGMSDRLLLLAPRGGSKGRGTAGGMKPLRTHPFIK